MQRALPRAFHPSPTLTFTTHGLDIPSGRAPGGVLGAVQPRHFLEATPAIGGGPGPAIGPATDPRPERGRGGWRAPARGGTRWARAFGRGPPRVGDVVVGLVGDVAD
jgi:hypothetical protein